MPNEFKPFHFASKQNEMHPFFHALLPRNGIRCASKRSIFNIVCGDSTKAETYDSLFASTKTPKLKADILITDPPYCLLVRKRTLGNERSVRFDSRSKTNDAAEVPRFPSLSSYRDFTRSWISLAKERLNNDRNMIIWTNVLGRRPIIDVCLEFDYHLQGEYLWAKSTVKPQKNTIGTFLHPTSSRTAESTLRVYESALIFGRSKPIDSDYINIRGQSIIRHSIPWLTATPYYEDDNAHIHPCHKPKSALLPLLTTWTRDEDVILDPFAGSGGILSTALQLGNRHYLGIEIMPMWHKHCNSLVK